MTTLNVNNQTVIDTLGNQVFSSYDEALQFGIKEMGWDEKDVLDRNEKLSLKLEEDGIIDLNLDCIMLDSGSDDYLFYIS